MSPLMPTGGTRFGATAAWPSFGGSMAAMTRTMGSTSRLRREEALDFRLIFAASFIVCLMAALVGRLLPFGRAAPSGMPRRSIIGEARAGAGTCVAFAFMA